MAEHTEISDVTDQLWHISGKLRVISELLFTTDGEAQVSERGLKGMSFFLEDLSREIDDVTSFLEQK